MTTRAGHSPLSPDASAWLAALSAPRTHFAVPSRRMVAAELAVLIEAALAHGTLPIVARNLRRFAAGDHVIVDGANAQQLIDTTVKELDQRLLVLAGQNLLLVHHASRIMSEFKRAALPAQVIKGPVFARRLYEHPNDRNFTDVDILIDPVAVAASCAILERLGYVQAQSPNRGGSLHGEYKWLAPDNDGF